jgi:hypothetical protein
MIRNKEEQQVREWKYLGDIIYDASIHVSRIQGTQHKFGDSQINEFSDCVLLGCDAL